MAITLGKETFVPTKTIKEHDHLPWMNRNIKLIIKKLDKSYRQMTKRPTTEHTEIFKKLKNELQKSIRQSYQEYIAEIINPTVDIGNKKLWTMIKAIRRDSTVVAPLKDQGKLMHHPIDTATILNKQLQSVFSSTDTVQLPELGDSSYSDMPNITITTSGVIKSLQNLNPHKSARPD